MEVFNINQILRWNQKGNKNPISLFFPCIVSFSLVQKKFVFVNLKINSFIIIGINSIAK